MSDEVTVKKVKEKGRKEVNDNNGSMKGKKESEGSIQRKPGKRKHTIKEVLKK